MQQKITVNIINPNIGGGGGNSGGGNAGGSCITDGGSVGTDGGSAGTDGGSVGPNGITSGGDGGDVIGGFLVQTGDYLYNLLTSQPLILIVFLLVLIFVPIALITNRHIASRAVANQPMAYLCKPREAAYGKTLLSLPILLLMSVALFVLAPGNPSTLAANAPLVNKVDDAAISIMQGDTTGTTTFRFDVSGYTNGFDLTTQMDTVNSSFPEGVNLVIDGVEVSDSVAVKVLEWRETGPSVWFLTVTATVPFDAPISSDYAVFSFDYSVTDFANYYTFQDPAAVGLTDSQAVYFDPAANTGICDADMSIYPTANSKPDTLNVTDTRNGQVYRVRKLKTDLAGTTARCWMIDNLKLGDTSPITLTPADSQINANWELPAYSTSAVPTASAELVIDASVSAWCNNTANWSAQSITGCGYFYNFLAATAGWGTDTTLASDSPISICPRGWHLPSGDTSGEFAELYVAYGSDLAAWLPTGAFSGLFAGNYTSSGFVNQGNYGYWWSSMVISPGAAYVAFLNTIHITNVHPGTHDMLLHNLIGVRCLL